MITILNSSVLTTFGEYSYQPVTLETAKGLLLREGFSSAIGHEGNAILLSELMGFEIPFNRIEYRQEECETALVFKIKKRLQIGEFLSAKDLPETDYEMGLLIRSK